MTHRIPIRNAGVLALLALLLLPSRVPAQQPFPTDSSLRATLAALVGAGRAAGVVVGLLAADGTQRVVAYGHPGPGGLPLDGQSVFEIGSITKTFTGTLLADMVRRGEVAVEDPIATLLPADVSVPTRNGKTITLLDVTTHHSGLPRMPTNFAPARRWLPRSRRPIARAGWKRPSRDTKRCAGRNPTDGSWGKPN